MITISCSYCGCTYGTKEGGSFTSHGTCPTCHKIVMADFDAGGNCDPDEIRRIADLRLPACMRAAGL